MPTDEPPEFKSYFFERTTSDIMAETVDAALESESNSRKRLTGIEEEVLREQDKILFEADETMRRLFDDDFESYWAALQDPEEMHERLEEHRRFIEEELGRQWEASQSDDESVEHLQWGRGWENNGKRLAPQRPPMIVGASDAQDAEEDALYQTARAWAGDVHRLTTRLYYKEQRKDADVFRAHTGAMVVPAKILWGGAVLSMVDGETAELALRGYRLSLTFLDRVMRALKAMLAKDFGVGQDVAKQLDTAMRLRRELQQRIAWLEKRIQ